MQPFKEGLGEMLGVALMTLEGVWNLRDRAATILFKPLQEFLILIHSYPELAVIERVIAVIDEVEERILLFFNNLVLNIISNNKLSQGSFIAKKGGCKPCSYDTGRLFRYRRHKYLTQIMREHSFFYKKMPPSIVK
jgi:hypothetical protein